MKRITTAVILLLLTACSAFAGEEPLHYNIVNLDASSSNQVANDVMIVMMQATARKNSAAEAGAVVNEVMEWADSLITDTSPVQHRTMNYQTHPVYQNKTITGWSATQQLRLQSDDFDALTDLIGTMQQRLQIASMHFEVSPEKRKTEVDLLIVSALNAFQAKARLISKTLGAEDFTIVSISIRDNTGHTPYRGGAQMEAMAVSAAPVVEAGNSTIQVTVQGKIQLVY